MAEGTIQEHVIARAMKDPAFRQELLSNPKEVLAREYDFHLPEEVTVRVLEEPPRTLTLVLPVVEEGALELSDADLEAVSGRRGDLTSIVWGRTCAEKCLASTRKGWSRCA